MKRNSFLPLLAILVLPVATSGCLGKVRLQYDPLLGSAPARGEIAMGAVNNLRTKGGAKGIAYLGTIRGGFGNPFTVTTEASRELDVVLRELFIDVLQHSGYDVQKTKTESGVPSLVVDVLHFWCDGYTGYKVSAVVKAKLISQDGESVLAERTLESEAGFAIVVGYSKLHAAYNRVVNQIAQQAVAFVQSPEFETAYRNATARRTAPVYGLR